MFYHEDGLPDEDAFVDYLVQMADGETVKIPEGMRKQDSALCVGAAEMKTHICFEIKGGIVLASEDPYVTILLNSKAGSEGYAPVGQIELFRQAIRKVRKKSKNKFSMKGDRITIEP